MEEPTGPLCQSVAFDVVSYAAANRPKKKGTQKNLHLGQLLQGIATYGNDNVLIAFFHANLEKFSDPTADMGSAFLGRAILCGVRAFLNPADEKRVAFQTAYDAELKSKVLAPDPDKKVPAKKERPEYVTHLKATVETKLIATNQTEVLQAYLSLFRTVCNMEDTPLRGHLVDALKAHFAKDTVAFSAAAIRIRELEAEYLKPLALIEPTIKDYFAETKAVEPAAAKPVPAKTLTEDLKDPATSYYLQSMREYAARKAAGSSLPLIGGRLQDRVDYTPIGNYLADVCALDVEFMLASLYAILRKLYTDETLQGKVETSVFVEKQLESAFQFYFTEASRKEKYGETKLSSLTYEQRVEILRTFETAVFVEYSARQNSEAARESAQEKVMLLRKVMSDVLAESTSHKDRETILQALLCYVRAVKNPENNNLLAAAFKAKVLELKYDSIHHKFQQLCEKTLPHISTEIGEYRTEQLRQSAEAATVAVASKSTTATLAYQYLPDEEDLPAAEPQPPRATVVVYAQPQDAQQAERDETGKKSLAERAKAQLARLSRGSKDKLADADKQLDTSFTK